MTAQDMAALLNEAIAIDPACISSLFMVRRACNKHLTDHPHIQVGGNPGENGVLRFIGLLNGMLLASGSTDVLVSTEDDEKNQNVLRFDAKPFADFLPK